MTKLAELDRELARRFGPYASYATDVDPILEETHGDGPTEEVDRLLDHFATPTSHVLDLGCGVGFTLCRLAPRVASIWGLEPDPDRLAAARMRVAEQGLENTTVVAGSTVNVDDVARLPDETFDLVLSRRGPNVNSAILEKMRPTAMVVQEVFQDPLGLLEFFGRKTLVADLGDNPGWLVEEYSWLGLMPVSIKEYYFESYFRDAEHLAAYLSLETMLFSWPMPAMPYEETRDRAALELYVRYNSTPKGVRVINHRMVYLFRRERMQYAPVAPDLEPLE